jgi:hypothetical protein
VRVALTMTTSSFMVISFRANGAGLVGYLWGGGPLGQLVYVIRT